jgi:hypothetical protein
MGIASWLRERWRRDREAAAADPRDLLLAAVPVLVGVVGAALLFPRAVVPVRVPLPVPNRAVLGAEARLDKQRAKRAETETLPAAVRELGGAFRAWNQLAFRDDDDVEHEAHAQALRLGALAREVRAAHGDDALLALRAVQLEAFLAELARFEATGDESDELRALAGNVVARMQAIGWIDGHRANLAEESWRVLYRSLWNRAMGVAGDPAFALSLDDDREVTRLQLAHPHPPETERALLAAELRAAKTPEACRTLAQREVEAADRWRLEKVEAWAHRDPCYPVAYARGVLLFRTGRFAEASRAFAEVRAAGGAFAERAFFHERAAQVAMFVE